MFSFVKKISDVWGLVATGPAIWGTASIVSVGGLIVLEPDSTAYILAVAGVVTIAGGCGIVGCLKSWSADREKQELEDRLADLEEGYGTTLQQLRALQAQVNPGQSYDLTGDTNKDEVDVELDVELDAENVSTHSTTATTANGDHEGTPLMQGEQKSNLFSHQPEIAPSSQPPTPTQTPTHGMRFDHS